MPRCTAMRRLRDRFTLWPPYQNAAKQAEFFAVASPDEIAYVRSQYGGKLTMVDRWFGRLMEAIDAQGLWDDTAVIVTTDHGHDLGERGGFGKQFPHFDSHANIPMLVWHPEMPGRGRRLTGLDQHGRSLRLGARDGAARRHRERRIRVRSCRCLLATAAATR